MAKRPWHSASLTYLEEVQLQAISLSVGIYYVTHATAFNGTRCCELTLPSEPSPEPLPTCPRKSAISEVLCKSDCCYSEQPQNITPTLVAAAPAAPATTKPTSTIEEALEQGKRAFALKKYEQAVDHYATALEMMCVLRRICAQRAPY